jgi:hypothetical protein
MREATGGLSRTPPPWRAMIERAQRCASEASRTIALQYRRLKTSEADDAEHACRCWADLQLLIIALRSLRRSAELAALVPMVQDEITVALSEFDRRLPSLWHMRNVEEHFDKYELLHQEEASGGTVLHWTGGALNIDHALQSADRLLATMNRLREACGRG